MLLNSWGVICILALKKKKLGTAYNWENETKLTNRLNTWCDGTGHSELSFLLPVTLTFSLREM